MHRKALGCAALKIPELAGGFSCPARARARRDGGGHPWLSLRLSATVTERAPLKKGVIKGGGMPPPLELNYIKPSPSRACEVTLPLWYGRGRGGEQGWAGTRPETRPAGETGVGSRKFAPSFLPGGAVAYRPARRVRATSPGSTFVAAAPLLNSSAQPRKLFVKSLTKNF